MSMENDRSSPMMAGVVACVVLTVGAMVVAVILATQKPTIMIVGGANTSAAVPADTKSATAAASPAPVAPEVLAERVEAVPAIVDPWDSAWQKVKASELALQPQQVAAPMLDSVTIPTLTVQTVYDQQRIAWRLSWKVNAPAHQVETGQFPDAVAIQFPVVDGAPFTMGAKDKPVRVLHWKAIWQKDVDEGFQEVHHRHPNFWSDLYWFASGEFPFALSKSFRDEHSRQWLVAYSAGNPMAEFQRKTPLEELSAEGLGSVTHVPDSISSSRGVWKDGYWAVVIDRPLEADDPLFPRLKAGANSQIAFAVWDGASANVGARKHWVGWIPFKVKP